MEVCENDSINFRESEIEELVEDVRNRLADYSFPIPPKLDFDFIAKFIRVKKYKPESAAEAIHRYYQHINGNKKRLTGIRSSDYARIYDSRALTVIKNKFKGTKIAHSRVKNWDHKNVSLSDLVDSCLLLSEELQSDEEIQPYGNIGIVDLDGLGFSMIKHVTVMEMKYVVHMALDGIPARLTAIHILNPPYLYWPLHKIIMKLLPQKIRRRVHIHADMASLHKHVDRSVLPESLGGFLDDEEAIDTELMKRLLNNDTCYKDFWSGEEDLS